MFPQLVKKLERLGCEESIVGLILPTGYAFNHDGTCLYFAAAPIFLAQAVGIELTLPQQLGLLGILLVTSKGGAGVAGRVLQRTGGHAAGVRRAELDLGAHRGQRLLRAGAQRVRCGERRGDGRGHEEAAFS